MEENMDDSVAPEQAHERPRRIVIVGGVAGGMSAATRLRRLDESAQIIVIERSGHVSYANCGLPYFVGGVIEDEADLLLQTPGRLYDRFRLEVQVDTEVIGIDPGARVITVQPTGGGLPVDLPYDELVLSPGAQPIRPPIDGFERVRVLRTVEDAERLFNDVAGAPTSAVVIGGGFIGIETAENLSNAGIPTTIVEAAHQLLPPLDPEMAILVEAELLAHGIEVWTGSPVAEITSSSVILSDGTKLPAELVVGSVGVRPDTRLATMAHLDLGPHGGIAVDADGLTSDPHIHAVGDAVEKVDSVGGGSSLVTLANVANRQGRRVADHIAGRSVAASTSLGTAIVKVFDRTVAMTGWSEARLKAADRPYRIVRSHPMSHATYYPGAEQMSLKLLFDPADGEILGAQAVGGSGVDKRIDVIATAMSGGISAPGLADLELAYAPPFSSAKDPVNMLGYMAENVLSGECDLVEADDLEGLVDQGWSIVDVRTTGEHAAGSIPGSSNVPLDVLRDRLPGLTGKRVVVYCQVGQRGHTATALLSELGVEVRNLDGGWLTWQAASAARSGSAQPLR
jgi:NADPH-dependent 2,4-dienoyl-CoA reductase/sulfur reductase-like enzyme/rhodanese-related sulfurtransferase